MDGLILNFIFPFLVAVVSYILLNKLDKWKERRNQSILGAVIIESMIEEVEIGYDYINKTLTSEDHMHPGIPPRKSWNGMNTIPNEVLLRIIATTKNIKPKSFPPRQIRTHCKNYFDHMLTNWDTAKNTISLTPFDYVKSNYPKYGEAAFKVLTMLEQTRDILLFNSKKWLPS